MLELLEKTLPDYADQSSKLTLPFNHNISIKQMFFRYSKDTPDILKRINLNIKNIVQTLFAVVMIVVQFLVGQIIV